jgi:DNA-binding LacI/PurR family transcriptional regulator
VVCYNDMSALGAMHRIHGAGFTIPGDISIVGFDDLHMSQYLNPPLTTIRQPMHEMGRMAMQTLISILSGVISQQHITVPGQLIVRASSAAPREIS